MQEQNKKDTTIKKPAAALLTENGVQQSASAQRLSAETRSYYGEWKRTYLRTNPYAKDETQYYVFYGEQTYEQVHAAVPVTVSEAHGYGMLITVLMAEYDSGAKDIFDGLYRYYLAHTSSIGPHLMAWQQSDNGEALVDTEGCDSATDGDLDIAYALLLADTVWGSSGTFNYRQAAALIIADIMEYDVSHTHWVMRLGDWVNYFGPGDKFFAATRSSDFMLQYFPVFAAVTGDARWMQVYEQTNAIIRIFTGTAQSKTGMLPDFCVPDPQGGWTAAPENFLESEYDEQYYYNACRTPWLIGMDALINGNPDAQTYAERVTAFMKADTGGDPEKIRAGYRIRTGEAFSDYSDLCFTAPLMLAAKAAGDAQWHDAIRRAVMDLGTDSYFGNTIAMLCLISDDGGWLVPAPKE